jgi:malate synthase
VSLLRFRAASLEKNINVGILYTEAWLRGAVALYNLMEDAATAEISRTQVWQWLHNRSCYRRWKNFNMTLYKDDDEVEKSSPNFGEENIKQQV